MAVNRLSTSDFLELNEDALIEQIAKHFEVDAVFDEDEIVEWCADNKDPEEVFSEKKLVKWAEENGFTR